MVDSRCIKCMWYDNVHESLEEWKEHNGYCRKHKPIPCLQSNRYYGLWPIVNEFDFCGEFRGDK